MSSYLQVFKKWANFQKSVYTSLGWKEIVSRLVREGNVRVGTLVGSDKYGNDYYENNYYFLGRNRFMRYPHNGHRYNYDGSQIPSEWHRWMHFMTDEPPTSKPPAQEKWMADHVMNLSGTDKRYVPYSTTKPKIQAWQPPKSQ